MARSTLDYRPEAPIVPELASGAVIVREGSQGPVVLLLHHREEGRWCLPKGHVDPGESLAEAAVREVTEETGFLSPQIGAELAEVAYRFYDPRRRTNVQKTVVYFLAAPGDGELRLEPTFDNARWASFAEAVDLVAFATDRSVLETARRRSVASGAESSKRIVPS